MIFDDKMMACLKHRKSSKKTIGADRGVQKKCCNLVTKNN